MQKAREYFDALNHGYLTVHKTKEDLFWATYMATSDDQEGFARAENAYKEFIADPAGSPIRGHISRRVRAAPPGPERDAAASRPDADGSRCSKRTSSRAPTGRDVDARDRRCRGRALRSGSALTSLATSTSSGESEVASLPMLATNLATNPRRGPAAKLVRRAARHRALGPRSRVSRARGAAQPFRARARLRQLLRLESPEERAADDARRSCGCSTTSSQRTEAANTRALAEPAARARHERRRALEHPVLHVSATSSVGSIPICRSAWRCAAGSIASAAWAFSSGARRMQLDLLERTGKHQNGFCHGPVPSWIDERGRVGAGGDQLHRGGQAGSGRAAASARSTRSSTKAVTPRTSRTWCRTRRASRRNMRRRRWPTRRRSRCSATASCRMPTGSCDTRRQPEATRSRRRSFSSASPAASPCARSTRGRSRSCPTSSRRCIGCRRAI